jgi:hypothetical protein
LAELQSEWEAAQVESQRTSAQRAAELEAIRAELTAQGERLEEQQRQYEGRLAELQSRESEVDQRRGELESRIAATVAPAVMSVAPVSEPATAAMESLVAEGETDSAPVAEVETVKITAPPNAAPVDLAAVLRRTGFNVDLADEVDRAENEEQSEDNVHSKDDASDSESAEKPAVDISAPVPRFRKPVGPGEEQEVSIDEYMNRLLARSRGDSAPSSAATANVPRAPAAVPPAAMPRPTQAAVVSAPQTEPPKPGETVEMAPRAAAPERQVDLRAMRQLANLSAKSALHKHESKRLSGDTRTKLLVTSVSAVVGVSLLVLHQLPGAPPVTIYGAAASFAVAALWGVNYASLMARLAGERTAYMDRHLKAGEEPAAKDKEETL